MRTVDGWVLSTPDEALDKGTVGLAFCIAKLLTDLERTSLPAVGPTVKKKGNKKAQYIWVTINSLWASSVVLGRFSIGWVDAISGTLRLATEVSEEVEGGLSPEVKPGILLAIFLFRCEMTVSKKAFQSDKTTTKFQVNYNNYKSVH